MIIVLQWEIITQIIIKNNVEVSLFIISKLFSNYNSFKRQFQNT